MPPSQHASQIQHGQSSGDNAPRELTLLVLLADTPIPTLLKSHGDYHSIFTSLFQRSASTLPEDVEPFILTVKSYDVVNEPWEYPTEQELSEAAGLLITGSAASAYEDKPWINKLIEYTASLPKAHPDLRLIGICYGMQIAARAFGSTAEKNAKGWELGVRTLNLTETGRKLLLGKDADSRDTITIHQVHQDHVPNLPDNFSLLGSTVDCAVQGMVSPLDAKKLSDVRIFCLQGHPEFDPSFVTEVINAREAKGILSKELADRSREYAALHDEGVGIGATILRILLKSDPTEA